jgi:hypothetical protein
LAPTVGITTTGFCYLGGILQLFSSTRLRNFAATDSSKSRIIIFNIQIASGWDALIFDGKTKHQRLRYREAGLRSDLIQLEVVQQVPRKSHSKRCDGYLWVPKSKELADQSRLQKKKKRGSTSQEARADKQAAIQDWIPSHLKQIARRNRHRIRLKFIANLQRLIGIEDHTSRTYKREISYEGNKEKLNFHGT